MAAIAVSEELRAFIERGEDIFADEARQLLRAYDEATEAGEAFAKLQEKFLLQCEVSESLRAKLERVRILVDAMRDAVERRRADLGPKTGMQVPYHGDFSSAVPSVLNRLDWYVRAFGEALASDTPTREPTALTDARELLERWVLAITYGQPEVHHDTTAWLAAHPEPGGENNGAR